MTLVQLGLGPPRSSAAVAQPIANADRKILYLMNDFTVQEHVCNLRCSYCLNFENELKGGKPWVPLEKITLEEGAFGWQRALSVLDTCRARAHAPILRFSGGEVLAIQGSVAVIEHAAKDWERVQVLTNATLVMGETLERLAALENINLCCSVDGHTTELNRLRVKHAGWAQRILDGLYGSIREGIPVEVNMVLTSHNLGAVLEFAEHLHALPRRADVRLMPFPVRGDVALNESIAGTLEQCGPLRELIRRHHELADVLPPVAYLERLLAFYVDGRRTHGCKVPLSYFQTFDDGVLASCANCWSNSLGNVLDDPAVFEGVGKVNIHKLFLREPPRFPFCRGCFTPFDVANVYFSGDCSLEEIAAMDIYSSPGVKARLKLLRDAWSTGDKSPVWVTATSQETSHGK